MATDPDKYDDLASHVLGVAEAEGVVLIVINGTRGSGFSARYARALSPEMPQILRDIANQIEAKGA